MSNEKLTIIRLVIRLTKKILLYKKVTYFLEPYTCSKNKIKFELELLKYATKDGLKYTTGLDISKLDNKFDLADLKSNIENLDFEKLETTPVDLSKLSNAVKTDVAKKTLYDKLVKKVNTTHTINISDLVKKADFDTKMEELKKNPSRDKYITANNFSKFSGALYA